MLSTLLLYVLSDQMERIWKAVAKYNSLTVQQLGVAEMVALNGFICGLNESELGQLEPNSFMLVSLLLQYQAVLSPLVNVLCLLYQ